MAIAAVFLAAASCGFTATAGTAAETTASLHRVARGETLQSIAATEHVSIEQIARLNGLQGREPSPGTVLTLNDRPLTTVPVPQLNVIEPVAQAPLSALQLAGTDVSAADLRLWIAQPHKATRTAAIRRFVRGIVNRTSSLAMSLTRNAIRFIGTPYVFGGTSTSGFDCSGYVQYVFAMLGVHLPRTADAQYYAGARIRGQMSPGDLVFFQTYEPGPSHVGIYLGEGKFVHSSSHGVMISRLADDYWASRYLGAKRYTL